MEIDIRSTIIEEITVIRVSDQDDTNTNADVIVKGGSSQPPCYIEDSADGSCLGIFDKDHALRVIEGLQKAIDLGWFE
jgi:hypothetical protein